MKTPWKNELNSKTWHGQLLLIKQSYSESFDTKTCLFAMIEVLDLDMRGLGFNPHMTFIIFQWKLNKL